MSSNVSSAFEPLGEEGVDQERPAFPIALHVPFVAEQPFERLAQRRARNSVLAGEHAAAHSLSVGERHAHDVDAYSGTARTCSIWRLGAADSRGIGDMTTLTWEWFYTCL